MQPLEAWQAWRAWLRVQGSGSRFTVRTYTTNVLRFLAETGAKPLMDYTEDDCAAFLVEFAPRGAARHGYAKALRSFFRYCQRHHLVSVNPMEEIHTPKPRRVPPVTLTSEELGRLLIAAVFILGERQAWALLLTYLLGLRRIEAAGLRWSDIRSGETGLVIEIHHTKAADQRDPLPLTPVALEALARLRELPTTSLRAQAGYILGASEGTISGWVHRAGTAAELPARKVGAHRLRATVATRLLREGVDVRTVQKLLGHLRLESTAWYLAEAGEAEVRSALHRLPIAV